MILYLDFETFYDTKGKYSLRCVKTIEYVRDSRFEIHGVAVKEDDNPTVYISSVEDMRTYFNSLDWSKITLVCHNTYFDGLILFEHFNKIPHRYHDTLSMGRALIPFAPKGHSLDSLDELLGGPGKIKGVLERVNGIRPADVPEELKQELGEYACIDVDRTVAVYKKLIPALPLDEQDLMHLTLSWGCAPSVRFNVQLAQQALIEHNQAQAEIIKKSKVKKTILSSNPKFANFIINDLNLEPPTKLNPKGKVTFAFSKDDLQFQELMTNHSEHSPIWKARLAAKSNIDRTRLESLIRIGEKGALPMPLKYCGAHTLRWSGGDGINPQNRPKKGAIRQCITAPPGYVIIVLDQKQIEMRVNMWFCNEPYWLRVCHESDIYIISAADYYGVPPEQVTPAQRFFGKTIELGLGYGMGWKKYRRTCALKEIYLTPAEALGVVTKYRTTRPNIPWTWELLNQCIINMYTGVPRQLGCITFIKNGIQLPNQMTLCYANLHPTEDGDWLYGKPGKYKKVYGGLLLENIVQALARVIIGQNILDIHREIPEARIITSTHDEIAALVREEHAKTCFDRMAKIMSGSPNWATDLPLAVEGNFGPTYVKD